MDTYNKKGDFKIEQTRNQSKSRRPVQVGTNEYRCTINDTDCADIERIATKTVRSIEGVRQSKQLMRF